jgi:hypothetical protein
LLVSIALFTCHPSPQAEDLLLPLPFAVAFAAVFAAVFVVAFAVALLLPLGTPSLQAWPSQPNKIGGFSPWGMPSFQQ